MSCCGASPPIPCLGYKQHLTVQHCYDAFNLDGLHPLQGPRILPEFCPMISTSTVSPKKLGVWVRFVSLLASCVKTGAIQTPNLPPTDYVAAQTISKKHLYPHDHPKRYANAIQFFPYSPQP